MAKRPPKKPKLTDAERHKRFVEAAREVDASEDAADFDKAFETVTRLSPADASPESAASEAEGAPTKP